MARATKPKPERAEPATPDPNRWPRCQDFPEYNEARDKLRRLQERQREAEAEFRRLDKLKPFEGSTHTRNVDALALSIFGERDEKLWRDIRQPR